MSFNIGDRIAHPMHGAGTIDHIEKRRVNNIDREYYVLKLSVSDMVVMIPCDSCEEVGIRYALNEEDMISILSNIPDVPSSTNINWNKRYRENMTRIKSGKLADVASVVKDMYNRENNKGLSNGERKMLHAAKLIILSELVLATGKSYEAADSMLSSLLI